MQAINVDQSDGAGGGVDIWGFQLGFWRQEKKGAGGGVDIWRFQLGFWRQKGARIRSQGIHSFLAFALLKKAPRELRGIDRILSEQTVAITYAFCKMHRRIAPNSIFE